MERVRDEQPYPHDGIQARAMALGIDLDHMDPDRYALLCSLSEEMMTTTTHESPPPPSLSSVAEIDHVEDVDTLLDEEESEDEFVGGDADGVEEGRHVISAIQSVLDRHYGSSSSSRALSHANDDEEGRGSCWEGQELSYSRSQISRCVCSCRGRRVVTWPSGLRKCKESYARSNVGEEGVDDENSSFLALSCSVHSTCGGGGREGEARGASSRNGLCLRVRIACPGRRIGLCVFEDVHADGSSDSISCANQESDARSATFPSFDPDDLDCLVYPEDEDDFSRDIFDEVQVLTNAERKILVPVFLPEGDEGDVQTVDYQLEIFLCSECDDSSSMNTDSEVIVQVDGELSRNLIFERLSSDD